MSPFSRGHPTAQVPGCNAPRFEESALAQRLSGGLSKAAFDDFTQVRLTWLVPICLPSLHSGR